MAEDGPAGQMSLVPYASTSREVVLQQGGAIVIYDNQSKSLSVGHDPDLIKDESECPYCHRPYHDNVPQDEHSIYGEAAQSPQHRSFVDPEYFRMLAQSQRSSPAQSGADTPLSAFSQYIPRALRSGRSRDVSGSQPPPDAEFVGSEPNAASGHGISSSAFSPGYFKQLFREERELGRGGNGVVLLVEHVLDGFSLGQFACKRIPVGNDHRWLEKVLVEVRLLTQVSHTNLVKYHWVWVEEYQPSSFGPRIPCVWILQQYCDAGDLHHYVVGPRDHADTAESRKARHRRQSKGKLTPADVQHRQSKLTLEEIFSFFKDITSGLHHLHSKGYIHRDVKPSNCLLHTDQGRMRVLLSDFGEVQAAGTRRGSTGATGTISYCAPEVLRVNQTDGRFGDFTTKSDIFSLGMIVYFMCFGHLPYVNAFDEDEDTEDLDLLREEIKAWQGFDEMSRARRDMPDRLYRYLQRLLSVDPNERPSTDAILSSIKANSNIGDNTTQSTGSTRVIPVETPAKQRRAQSPSFPGRPSFSPPSRDASGIIHDRSLSPRKRSRVDENHIDRPRSGNTVYHSPLRHSPRLILPPPDESLLSRVLRQFRSPSMLSLIRGGLLLGKITMLMATCAPFAPRAVLLYPLLLVAVLELIFLELQAGATTASFMLYVMAVWILREHFKVCEAIDHPSLR